MTRRNEVVVGAVIVVSAAVVLVGTLWLQGAYWGQRTVDLQARLREIGQLTEGNNVKLRGVSIGRVEQIAVEPGGGAVIVSMRVDADVELPADPVVLLSPESLFGDWQAEILPRSRYPHLEYEGSSDPSVLSGYALPDISQLTAVAEQIAENLAVLTDRVELAFTEETALNVRRAIENIQEVSEQLTRLVEQQATTLDELATTLRETTGQIGDAAEVANRTFQRLEVTIASGDVDSLVLHARSAASHVDRLTSDLASAVDELEGTLVTIDSTFARIDRLTAQLESGQGGLGRLIGDSLLYVRAEQALDELQSLLADLRKNPQRYIKLRVF